MSNEKKKKGKKPDYAGEGVAVWENKDKNGNTYLTVRLFGRNVVMMVNRFFTAARHHLFWCYAGTDEAFDSVF